MNTILPSKWKIKYLPITIGEEGWKMLINKEGHAAAKKLFCCNCRVRWSFCLLSLISVLMLNAITIRNSCFSFICLLVIIVLPVYICIKEMCEWDFDKTYPK